MVTTIKKGASKKEIHNLLELHGKRMKAGTDIKKYCGVIQLKEDPMELQKIWRNEWE